MNKVNLNRYFILPILAVSLLMNTACSDFLNVEPTSQLESVYFENENRVDRGIGSIYAEIAVLYNPNMQSGAFSGAPLYKLWLLPGDDLTTDNNSNSDFEAFANLNPSNGTLSRYWSILYATIARANFMLEKLEDPEVLAVIKTPGRADACKGEALFLRSYCNYKLWDGFRKAPNQKVRIKTIEESYLESTNGFELLDQAIADLKLAVDLLPDSWNDINKGRVFKNSARGLLVKCYELRANYASLYGGDKNADYQNAIRYFEAIDPAISTIDGVPFGNNFDYATENNKESLFEYQASHNVGEDNPWLNNNFGGASGSLGAIYIEFWSHTYSEYMFGSIFGPTNKLIAKLLPSDPRFDETMIKTYKGSTVGDPYNWVGKTWTKFSGYQFLKYINNAKRGPLDTKYGTTSPNNPRILRLADVKLAAAEAYLQTGNELEARKQVNDVRKRARNSKAGGVVSLTPADYTAPITMKEIMDERMLELAGEEGIRFTDLKRWHVAGFINLSTWTAADFGYDQAKKDATFSFKADTHLLFPIPMTEMNRNPKLQAVGNNPGYN